MHYVEGINKKMSYIITTYSDARLYLRQKKNTFSGDGCGYNLKILLMVYKKKGREALR